LFEDPEACPDDLATCQVDSHQASCVDTDRSSEHCGGCGQACSSNELCQAGGCICSSAPGIVSCHGLCVDSLTSREHCGACDQPCASLCIEGICRIAGTCDDPEPLPPEGGVFAIDLSHQSPAETNLCALSLEGEHAFNERVLSFTPLASGLARFTIDVESGLAFPVLGVTTDPTCLSPVLACMIDAEEFGGVPIEIEVDAGITYLIRVAIFLGDVPAGSLVLSVEAP
jgi:hypothetical protein